MRYASVLVDGTPRLVAEDDRGRLLDLTAATGLTDVQQALGAAEALPDAPAGAPELDPASVRYRPVIPQPAHILCVGFNYANPAAEAEKTEPAQYPTLFSRFPDAHVGHDQPLLLPTVSSMFDYEGEIAVVIGRGGRHIPREAAMDAVAGYTVFTDNGMRDFQFYGTQATAGKNFESSGSFGPFLAPAAEVGDPGGLELYTRINGEQMQHGKLADLIFDIPALISYISSWARLQPGDLIATGTPPGIGARRVPPRYLLDGDALEVEVPGVGTLRNQVVQEQA